MGQIEGGGMLVRSDETYNRRVGSPDLFRQVADLLHGELAACKQLDGGSSAGVWQAELETSGGTRLVVIRTHPGNQIKGRRAAIASKEFRLLEALWARDMAVAEPLLVIESEATLVTSWIEGTSQVARSDLASSLDQMVSFLVGLHRIEPTKLAIDELGPLEDPVASLPDYLPGTSLGERLGAALEAGTIGRPTNSPVLVHGDYWPGNILWNDGHLAAVIDWEDAAIGDPLADLACARVELLCQYSEAAMDSFTAQYLSAIQLDTAALAVWECYVSATALTSMHLWGLNPDEELRRRTLTSAFFESAATRALT